MTVVYVQSFVTRDIARDTTSWTCIVLPTSTNIFKIKTDNIILYTFLFYLFCHLSAFCLVFIPWLHSLTIKVYNTYLFAFFLSNNENMRTDITTNGHGQCLESENITGAVLSTLLLHKAVAIFRTHRHTIFSRVTK